MGSNSRGQLGLGNEDDKILSPQLILKDQIISITCSYSSTFILTSYFFLFYFIFNC